MLWYYHHFSYYNINNIISLQICVRCVFRVFGVRGRIYASSNLVVNNHNNNDTFNDSEKLTTSKEIKLCKLCLGILQFRFYDDREMVVEKDGVDDMAVMIADMVKREGYKIDGFSLEVSIPPILLENDNSLV